MRRAARLVLALALAALAAGPLAAAETDQHGRPHAWDGPSPGYTVLDFAANPRAKAFAAPMRPALEAE